MSKYKKVVIPNNWTPCQIAEFQAHFDFILSRDTQLKSKVRFLPGNIKKRGFLTTILNYRER